MPGEIVLVPAQMFGVLVVGRLIERRPIERQGGMFLLQRVRSILETLVFLNPGLNHRTRP
jgi:hypothetical protein